MELKQEHCTACSEGTPALAAEEARMLLREIPGWTISEDGRWLFRRYRFKNFVEALAFVNKVGEVAEAEQHHPDLKLGWGYVEVHLQTHAAHGLHRNDFILAGKIASL